MSNIRLHTAFKPDDGIPILADAASNVPADAQATNLSNSEEYDILPPLKAQLVPPLFRIGKGYSAAETLRIYANWSLPRYARSKAKFPVRRPSSLCSFCESIFAGFPQAQEPRGVGVKTYPRFPHYNDRTDLQASAENGCGLCTKFMAATNMEASHPWDSGVQPWRLDYLASGTVFLDFGRDHSWGLELRIPVLSLDKFPVRQSPQHYFSYEVLMKGTYGQAVSYDSIGTVMNTKDGLPLAKEWLRRCFASHHICNNESEGRVNPTRLIDLSHSEIRLCLGKLLEEGVRYATTSHCWGKALFESLTTTTLSSYFQKIPNEALTKTFQDSIEIARYLGFQYLWIDSLCIIQDDAEDWRRESASMSNVYGFSSLNIAAASAANGAIGCFFDRKETWRTQFMPKIGDSYHLIDCFESSYGLRLSENVPLLSRGWVVQERVLSRRTLFFHETEIFWECDESQTSETFPTGYPPEVWVSYGMHLQKRPMSTDRWKDLMTIYSGCQLTRVADKLVAISGIAKRIHEDVGAEYVAGLWKDNLEYQLCWKRAQQQPPWWVKEPGTRPTVYRSPTWSWVSIDGAVTLAESMSGPVNLHIKVQKIDIKYLVPSDPFGQVLHATLRISCEYFFPATVRICESGTEVQQAIFVEPNTYIGGNFTLDCQLGGDRYGVKDAGWDYTESSMKKLPAYVLPVFTECEGDGGLKAATLLILRPTNVRPGQYDRMGLWELAFYGKNELKTVLDNKDCMAADEDYAEKSADGNGETVRWIDLV